MNVLKRERQIAVVRLLTEGVSMRATARISEVSRETVLTMSLRLGQHCHTMLDERMRALTCSRLEIDEIWSFVKKKQRQVTRSDDPFAVGDAWTFVAVDPATRLVPLFYVGKRDSESAELFMDDLASRLAHPVQISTDGLAAYPGAMQRSFNGQVDYAQITRGPTRWLPWDPTGPWSSPEHPTTNHVERQNLTMRMSIRRFTRASNGFSKSMAHHVAAIALHFAHYNFVRPHLALQSRTPAMAAGLADRPWTLGDLLDLVPSPVVTPRKSKDGRVAGKNGSARTDGAESDRWLAP